MHNTSYKLMEKAVDTYLKSDDRLRILDVGSYNVNGTYKPLFNQLLWVYEGLDIRPGPNVDIVMDTEGVWENIPDASYDVVISGQCLEHCERPWVIAEAIARVCKIDGLAFITAPWNHHIHRHPMDCWRILPDGMTALMTKHVRFKQLECISNAKDTFFIGKRCV